MRDACMTLCYIVSIFLPMLLYMQCTVVTKSSSNKCFFVSYQREQGEVEALKTIADMKVKPSALLRRQRPHRAPSSSPSPDPTEPIPQHPSLGSHWKRSPRKTRAHQGLFLCHHDGLRGHRDDGRYHHDMDVIMTGWDVTTELGGISWSTSSALEPPPCTVQF